METSRKHIPLTDGSHVAVVGGGPAGAFFARFILDLAREKGIDLNVTIFDGKSFTAPGPKGCNMCAGVIAETLVDNLERIGIYLPKDRVQRRISGYRLKTRAGEVSLYHEKRRGGIVTVFRGNGPERSRHLRNVSFDDFLLRHAEDRGARIISQVVRELSLAEDKVILHYGGGSEKDTFQADAAVVACGLNSGFLGKIQKLGIGYEPPRAVRACQMELPLPSGYIKKHFSDMIFAYSLGIPGIRFASIVPKNEYVTVTVVGNRNVKKADMWEFIGHPVVREDLPFDWKVPEKYCHCHPCIGLTTARNAFADRLVIIGDASWSRFYKNGLESAFRTARFAAEAMIQEGVSSLAFRNSYYRRCKMNIIRDNSYGRILFSIDRYISSFELIARSHLQVARAEKKGNPEKLRLILWNMFTGNAPYEEIFWKALDPVLQVRLAWQVIRNLPTVGRIRTARPEKQDAPLPLKEGGVVGIIGGGPAGSGCAIALKVLGEGLKKKLDVYLYERKDFEEEGNACVGVLSPPLRRILQTLEMEIPDEMVHSVITDYVLHAGRETIHLTKGRLEDEPTFSLRRTELDKFLLNRVRSLGVKVINDKVTDLNFFPGQVLIHTAKGTLRCDVVIGAFGLDERMLDVFEQRLPGYRRPRVLKSVLVDIPLAKEIVEHRLGNTLHAFLPTRVGRIEFGAITPKRNYVTVNVSGSRVGDDDLRAFLKLPGVRRVLGVVNPQGKFVKGIFPVSVSKNFYGHRCVLIGDASGLVRPYKGKGINTAIIGGIRAAETILETGVGRKSFQSYYEKCFDLIEDCSYGRWLRTLCRMGAWLGCLDPVLIQASADYRLYNALYNIVSGDESYRDIVRSTVSVELLLRIVRAVLRDTAGRLFRN